MYRPFSPWHRTLRLPGDLGHCLGEAQRLVPMFSGNALSAKSKTVSHAMVSATQSAAPRTFSTPPTPCFLKGYLQKRVRNIAFFARGRARMRAGLNVSFTLFFHVILESTPTYFFRIEKVNFEFIVVLLF